MMLPSLGYFSEVPCVFFLAGSCSRPHCHFRHCARDKTNDDGKLAPPTKTAKDGDSEWLAPNLRLSQVTHMVEKAVDRALLANPDKKLDRATMINQALETLRRDSLAKSGDIHRNQASSSLTATGFPSYKPTPISILNKRHIPVVAMPVKPMVIRKEKRPEEKTIFAASPTVTTPHDISQTSKLDAESAPDSMISYKPAENSSSESEYTKPLIQQISDFLGSDWPSANNDSSSPFLHDGESSGHSNPDSVDANVEEHLDEVINNQASNVDDLSENPNSSLPCAFEADAKSDVPLSPVKTDTCIDSQGKKRNIIEQEEIASEDITKKVEETGNSDKLPSKHKDPEWHKERSHKAPDRRRSSDSRRSVDSHKKTDKSVHRSKQKDGKSDQHKQAAKEKNGDDSQNKEKSMKESLRESCHKKPSLHHANFPKNHPPNDHSKSHSKKTDEKKAHHKSRERDHKKHKEKDHHSLKHDKSENDKKSESSSEKLKNCSKTSKFSHSKSKSSEKHSSSHSKEHYKARKRKADDKYEKHYKVVKMKDEHDIKKESFLKFDKNDDPTLEGGDPINELVGVESRRVSRESVKRKYSDSDHDVDFVDSPSPNHSAIVISSSSSEECHNDWAMSPPNIPEVSVFGEEDARAKKTSVDLKWSKAKEIIQRSANSAKPRIAHVPNVMSLLTAKTKILSQEKKLIAKPVAVTSLPSSADRVNENDEGPQPKSMKRVAHGSQGAASRPVVRHIDNTKLPPGIRQHYCNVFYDELCKFLDPDKAKKLAVDEELEVAKKCKIHKIYQNNCSLLLLKIRKMKGNIDKGEQVAEKWTSSSLPEFTYGLTLYQCFEKYLVSEEDLINNGYAMPLPGQPTCAFIEKSARKYSVPQPDEPFKRRCVNCRKEYEIDQDGLPTTKNDCNYHWGRMRRVGGRSLLVEKYSCCDGADDSLPCQSNTYHVWSGKNEDCIPGFVKTREWPSYRDNSDAGVYALDCEMCYTTRGLELARLTVVDLNEDVVFDEVIALEHQVLDYCTRFSGIDEDKMKDASMTFQQVQNWVLNHFFDKTILVGHSLENDLNALKIFHKCIVDTSITFPHKYGPPMKNSLKTLAMTMLALSIQENETGHDSKEDAVTCLKLMMKRIKEDAKVRKPRVIIGYAGKKR